MTKRQIDRQDYKFENAKDGQFRARIITDILMDKESAVNEAGSISSNIHILERNIKRAQDMLARQNDIPLLKAGLALEMKKLDAIGKVIPIRDVGTDINTSVDGPLSKEGLQQ